MTTRRRRTLLICALVLVAAGGTFAMRAALADLYSRIVSESGVAVQRGVSYGPQEHNRLDVYRPPGDQARDGPIAIFIYGGGWRSGNRSAYGFVGAALAARGITTVIADYRLYPEVRFPTFVEDAARAYAWTSTTLASASGKRRPIFVIGHSAGAYIAAMLALDARYLAAAGVASDRPAGLIGLAGPYAFDPTTFPSTADIFAPAATADAARPVTFVRPGAPPTLLMHGLSDETVRVWNTRALADALQAAGSPVRKLELEGIGHTALVLAISRPFRWRAPVLGEIVEFIRSVAGG